MQTGASEIHSVAAGAGDESRDKSPRWRRAPAEVYAAGMLIHLLLALPLTGSLPHETGRAQVMRVACLGDSITYGSRVVDRDNNAYPVQLSHHLGEAWEVRNFGAGGRTLSSDGDTPYVQSKSFEDALAWKPDIAIVMLGTNDTCMNESRRNWAHEEHLERDARGLCARLFEANSDARVLLCTPTAMFPGLSKLDEARKLDLATRAPRLERIGAALRAVASEDDRIDFLDLSRTLSPNQVVDGVHLTPFGAERLASRFAEAIRWPSVASLDLERALAARQLEIGRSEFEDFQRLDFQISSEGGAAFAGLIVAPHNPAAGYPWIWRARFFGHEPELDRELLSRGYHLAYCDVSNLYGSEAALDRYDRFHEFCTDLGLSERVTLEGMSRGGLVCLNWAARHPFEVEAIYLDNPVCDIRSWPGGKTGKRSEADWLRCLEAYGISEEEAAKLDPLPPEKMEALSRGIVPIALVMGSADEVVPPEENGEELVRRYRGLIPPIEVWRKPGAGHHPHGLHPVAPLLRWLLHRTGRGFQPTTRARPSVEYRGHPAGWGGGTWHQQVEAMRSLVESDGDIPVAFLGDSITQGLTGSADRLARHGGTRHFDSFHGERGAISLGLSGDRTEHLLHRIEHGALAEFDPRLIVLMIGVNNVNSAGHTGSETAAGVSAVIDALLREEPQAEILLCGPFPAGRTPTDPRRVALDQVHDLTSGLGRGERVSYMDLRPLFLDESGAPNSRMSGDHIHITPQGQRAWLEAIEPWIAERLKD